MDEIEEVKCTTVKGVDINNITVYMARIHDSDKYAVGYYVPHYMYDYHYLIGAVSEDTCGYPCENEGTMAHELKRIDIDTLVQYTHEYHACTFRVNEPGYSADTIVLED